MEKSRSPKGTAEDESLTRAIGAVSTPPKLVEFMVTLAEPAGRSCRILEPACGDAPFLEAFARRYGLGHKFFGIDIDPDAVHRAKKRVPFATIFEGDFLLWQPSETFDIVIGNPPYGIIGDASHYPIHILKERKVLYKKKFETWFGKFNIYGAFIEQALRLLKPGGKMVFVVPASWLILDDFTKLRVFLSSSGHLSVHYVGKVFPRRNVSCVVMVVEKNGKGLKLFDERKLIMIKPEYNGELIRFETEQIIEFEKSGISLGSLFEIYFAARSPEFRSHPDVSLKPKRGLVPVLTGRNLKTGWIDYEVCYSGFWMPRESAPTLRNFYGFPHIVVGHTKGMRVVASVDERCYPWREEFHLVPKEEKIDLSIIVDHLNSEQIQKYVRALYRDFVPHVTRTMLELVPIPPDLRRSSRGFISMFPG